MHIDPFHFSKRERQLLRILPEGGGRPRDLMRESGIPHASLYLAFEHLEARGFAERIIKDRKIYWRKTGSREVELRDAAHINVYGDREAVRHLVHESLKLPPASRITVLEGTQEESGWLKLFTEEETIDMNTLLAKRKIICENIVSESYFKDASRYLGNDWALSYKSRPIITYTIRRELIPSSAMLLVLPLKIILLYAGEHLALEIKNKEMTALITGMTTIVKQSGRKVTISEDFSFRESK
ncbi:MAG TPA: hypothetical protein VHC20_01035 [Candidatus Paceibacterota bacterium]|nr:hypothetical protein [Candidatus Paceibacterota bacterium]